MRFSIIVPVYNVEKYLHRCIDSIVNQNYKDYELILVDDGSQDNCPNICDEYASKYENISVVHQENQGLAGARNSGLDIAKGEWITFVDSDDWLDSDYFQTITEAIEKHEAQLYSFNARRVDDEKTLTERIYYLPDSSFDIHDEKQKFKFYKKQFMQYKIGWEAWSRVYKKSIIDKYNLRYVHTRLIMAEDYLFSFEYILHVNDIFTIEKVLYNYYQRDDSLLHELDHKTVIDKLVNLSNYAYEHIKENSFSVFEKNFYQLYFILMDLHVQGMLWQEPLDEIKNQIKSSGESNENAKKWLKEIRINRFRLWFQGRRRWL